jgi:hypothetical protein
MLVGLIILFISGIIIISVFTLREVKEKYKKDIEKASFQRLEKNMLVTEGL